MSRSSRRSETLWHQRKYEIYINLWIWICKCTEILAYLNVT